MKCTSIVAALLLLAGCSTGYRIVDAGHPPGFAAIMEMPTLAPGEYEFAGLRVLVARPVNDAALGALAPPGADRKLFVATLGLTAHERHIRGGYYAGMIVSDGSPVNLGHELRHYCDDVGETHCTPAIAALRALAH